MTNSTLERPKAATSVRTPRSTTSASAAPSRATGAKPKVVVRARLVSYPQTRKHAKAHRVETAVFRVLMFLFLAVTAYGVSSISGQVAVEKSRREELSARTRSKSLMLMEVALKSEIVDLTRPDRIDDWARANSFENVGGPAVAPAPKAESRVQESIPGRTPACRSPRLIILP